MNRIRAFLKAIAQKYDSGLGGDGADSLFRYSLEGIVFIKDGWGATDHVDVRNGIVILAGDPSYFSLGKEVWFWEAK